MFKSDYYNRVPVSKIVGKCMVMFVKVKQLFLWITFYSDFVRAWLSVPISAVMV